MIIAQVTKYFHPHPGGIESNAFGISKGIVERGDKALVFTSNEPKTKKHEVFEGIEIFRSTNLLTIFNAPFSPGILINLIRRNYDIIHVHFPDPFNAVFAWLASRINGKSLIITYHSDILKERIYHKPFRLIFGWVEKRVLGDAVKIIATTEAYTNTSEVLKRFKSKIVVIPNFVDADRFNPEVDSGSVRKKHGLEKERIVLFFGRLVPYKGVEYLIEAFRGVNNSILVIAGRGPLKEKLVKKAKGIEDIKFIEPEDDEIPSLYSSCDIFVLPSVTRQEAFGIALLEAMSSKKPVIATNISGMPSVVGECGILVKPRDPKALREAILKLLSDNSLRRTLGEKARKRVEEEFTLEVVVEKTIRLYRES